MALALVADAHLGGPGGDGRLLLEQLRRLPDQGCREVLFLGDLFHVWVGHDKYETDEIRALGPVLAQLRGRGLLLSYVEGNRDFFLGDGPYRRWFDRLGRELAFEQGGRRYLAVHGDGLNDRDWRYRWWRSLSKSPPARVLFGRLPRFLARRIVYGTESRLARTNWQHKKAIPVEVIRRYGERRLRAGFDVLLLGHFHEEQTFAVVGGAVRIVDAWFRSRRIEWFPEPVRAETA